MAGFHPYLRFAFCSLLALVIFSCKDEKVEPVLKKEVVVRQLNVVLAAGSEPYELDIDSNGVTDYRLLVSAESNASRDRAIFRLQGIINGYLTTVVHGTLRELNDTEQCDLLDPSVLQAGILESSETVGENLNDDWWMIGDYHYVDDCFGSSCNCPGSSADVEYVPLNTGSTGYIGVRFVRRTQKHYGWIEIERNASADPEYLIKRVAWRRTAGQPLVIEN